MKKIKYNKFIKEKDISVILREKFSDLKCPSCAETGIYAGCIETQYDEKIDEKVVLSFDVFCDKCGDFHGNWDNTDREYFLSKR